MNVITYDVYKNTVKKHDGFNPVTSEKNYTKLQFRFRDDDDWSNCTVITASFWISNDNIVKSDVELLSDDLTATFDIPSEFSGVKGALKVGLQGTYVKDNEKVTVSTNIITLNRNTGAIITQGVNQGLYEKLIALMEEYLNNIDSNFALKIKTSITDYLNAHPELTTTVQDGAISERKLDKILLSKLSFVTPQMFGAVGDGNADDTAALQSALDTGKSLFIPEGRYKITKTLYATDMYIDGDTNAVIVGDCGDNAVLELNTETANLGYISSNSYIKNITINANNSSYGLHYNRTHNLSLKNLKVKNFANVGILAGKYSLLTAKPSDWSTNYTAYYRLIDNKYTAVTDSSCPAFAENTFYSTTKSYNIETVAEALVIFNESAISGSVGIRNLSTDSYWKDIIVYNTEIGIEPGGNDIVTCHYWNSLADLVANSTAFVLRDNVNATLTACCSDSSRYAVRLGDFSFATINGLRVIFAKTMLDTINSAGDCVVIDSAVNPKSRGDTDKYYKTCSANITGLEVKTYNYEKDGESKTLIPKLLSDFLYGRYNILPVFWRNFTISSSFISSTIGNQPASVYQLGGLCDFTNVNGSRNISGTAGLNDCNIFNIGIFSCTTTTLNIPEAVKGMLICLSSGAYNWSQIYITSNSVYTRYSSNGTSWGAWIKINNN